MLYFTIKANVVNPSMLAEAITKAGPNIKVEHFAMGDSFQFHVESTENKALVAEAVIFQLAEQLNRVSIALKKATDQVSFRGGEII